MYHSTVNSTKDFAGFKHGELATLPALTTRPAGYLYLPSLLDSLASLPNIVWVAPTFITGDVVTEDDTCPNPDFNDSNNKETLNNDSTKEQAANEDEGEEEKETAG